VAKVSRRRGRLGVYWEDPLGKRHFVVCENPDERADLLARLHAVRLGDTCTVAAYAQDVWLRRVKRRLAPNTVKSYESTVRCYIVPSSLGRTKLIELKRRDCKDWAMAQVAASGRRTVGTRVSILRALLAEAVEDELIPVNPASAVIRALRISQAPRNIPAVSAEDGARLLEALRLDPRYPRVALLIHTGLRPGEARGLRWEDIDLVERTARIERQMHEDGRVADLKTRTAKRTVDLPHALVEQMHSWRARQQADALRTGTASTPWVLGIEPADARNEWGQTIRALRRALHRLGLPPLSTHNLRHAYASLQLSRGRDLVYVQRMLGHSSVALTADLYGSHLPRHDRDAADDLGNVLKGSQLGLFQKK
jgi:integrase